MLFLFYFLVLVFATAEEEQFSVSKFDHFVKVPSVSFHAGGRLTERHLQYLSSASYNSVLSISFFPTNDTEYNGVSGSFPSSEYELSLVSSFGMDAVSLTSNLTVEFLNVFVETLDSLKLPAYVHCHVSFAYFHLSTCILLS